MNKQVIFGAVFFVLILLASHFTFSATDTVPSPVPITKIKKTTYIYAGTLVASKSSDESAKTQYYVQDHLGSNMKVLDGILEKQTNKYYTFGETQSSGVSDNDYKFTGKEYDDETGLYYYGARYYKPELGRFIQADAITGSIVDPLTMNRYAYTKNNPLKYVDPSGNKDEMALETVGGHYTEEDKKQIAGGTGVGALFGVSVTGMVYSGLILATTTIVATAFMHIAIEKMKPPPPEPWGITSYQDEKTNKIIEDFVSSEPLQEDLKNAETRTDSLTVLTLAVREKFGYNREAANRELKTQSATGEKPLADYIGAGASVCYQLACVFSLSTEKLGIKGVDIVFGSKSTDSTASRHAWNIDQEEGKEYDPTNKIVADTTGQLRDRYPAWPKVKSITQK